MDQVKVGHWTADGGNVNIPLGFVPSYFMFMNIGEGTNPSKYEWWSSQQTDEAAQSQEGTIITGSSGVITLSADDAGITAYDTGTEGPEVLAYTTTVGDAATERTNTKPGSFVKPSTTGVIADGSDADRSLIFECVGEGTAVAEPTWPTAVGAQVTDGSGGNTFELVVEPTGRAGYQGVIIADNIQTNGQECYYLAISAGRDVDHGDVDGWVDGIDPNGSKG